MKDSSIRQKVTASDRRLMPSLPNSRRAKDTPRRRRLPIAGAGRPRPTFSSDISLHWRSRLTSAEQAISGTNVREYAIWIHSRPRIMVSCPQSACVKTPDQCPRNNGFRKISPADLTIFSSFGRLYATAAVGQSKTFMKQPSE